MVGADILTEIRLRTEELRTRVDWAGIGLAGAIAALTPWFVGLPDNPDLVLTTALVGVAVWGAP